MPPVDWLVGARLSLTASRGTIPDGWAGSGAGGKGFAVETVISRPARTAVSAMGDPAMDLISPDAAVRRACGSGLRIYSA